MFGPLKRLVVGRPIATYQADHHRFGLFGGLAVLSSDALSSVAYATEEVLRVLMIGGLSALSLGQPISLMIALLLLIVVFSYRKTSRPTPAAVAPTSLPATTWGRASGSRPLPPC